MNKNDMQSKLEKLYEAQENYFKLLEEFEEEISKFDKPISLFNITGSIDGLGIASVEESMAELEREMKHFGLKWDNEYKYDTFCIQKDSTKEEIEGFIKKKSKCGILYLEIEDQKAFQILAFIKETPIVYDVFFLNEKTEDFETLAKQVPLEKLGDIVCTQCNRIFEETECDLER